MPRFITTSGSNVQSPKTTAQQQQEVNVFCAGTTLICLGFCPLDCTFVLITPLAIGNRHWMVSLSTLKRRRAMDQVNAPRQQQESRKMRQQPERNIFSSGLQQERGQTERRSGPASRGR